MSKKKKDPERYPVILGPQDAEGRQRVLTFTPDGIEQGQLGPEGDSEGEPCAKVRIDPGIGPFASMEVISGSIRKGPAKVNSPAYRANWETIFGAKQEIGQA